jgi:hypothetical protein
LKEVNTARATNFCRRPWGWDHQITGVRALEVRGEAKLLINRARLDPSFSSSSCLTNGGVLARVFDDDTNSKKYARFCRFRGSLAGGLTSASTSPVHGSICYWTFWQIIILVLMVMALIALVD